MRRSEPFLPIRRLNRTELKSTLLPPERHPDIPENAKWLSGEGAGSWFVLEFLEELLELTRYSPGGIIECSGTYEEANGNSFGPGDSYTVDYPSNCNVVSLKLDKTKLIFKRISSPVLVPIESPTPTYGEVIKDLVL